MAATSGVQESEGSQGFLSESMRFIGFVTEITTPRQVAGRFTVSKASSQSFNALNGGVSAMIAETLSGAGAFLAAARHQHQQSVAVVELKINHLKAAPIGTEVFVSAELVHTGQRFHVWDVTFSKVSKPSKDMMGANDLKIAVSRVTVMVGLDGEPSEHDQTTKLFARL